MRLIHDLLTFLTNNSSVISRLVIGNSGLYLREHRKKIQALNSYCSFTGS